MERTKYCFTSSSWCNKWKASVGQPPPAPRPSSSSNRLRLIGLELLLVWGSSGETMPRESPVEERRRRIENSPGLWRIIHNATRSKKRSLWNLGSWCSACLCCLAAKAAASFSFSFSWASFSFFSDSFFSASNASFSAFICCSSNGKGPFSFFSNPQLFFYSKLPEVGCPQPQSSLLSPPVFSLIVSPLLWNAVGSLMNNTYSSFLGILHSQDNFFTPFSRLYFRLVWNPSSTFFLFSGPLRTRSTYRDYLSTYKLYSAIPLLPAPYGLVCCFQSHS